MRGVNEVTFGGNVSGGIKYGETRNGSPTCSFQIASDRHANGKVVVTAWVKVNVYGTKLVNPCQTKLQKGSYVVVVGELMNRDGRLKELVEIRARDIIFF
jgi:single-stranded DNA-binding protein